MLLLGAGAVLSGVSPAAAADSAERRLVAKYSPYVPGLALQYWFFYYFNQLNDLHEADWEGMQILFDSSSPRMRSKRSPARSASSSTRAARAPTGTTKVGLTLLYLDLSARQGTG